MITPRQLASRLRKALRLRRALRHRQRSRHALFVGVTGTSGKTTTTRLAAAILRTTGPGAQTDADNAINDLIRTVRATGPAERWCVAELAAAGPGTLDRRVALFQPDVAVLTMIGREHYTAYRSVEAIAAEKEKVVLALPADGIAVLNLDDPLVAAIAARTGRRVIGFGRDPAATLRLVAARSRWPEPLALEVEHAGRRYAVATQMHGEHLAVPVLAALGVAVAAGVPMETALAVVATTAPPEGRMQPVTTGDGVTFLRDDMKSPAWSFAAPFAFLREARAERKVAIVGTVSDTRGDSSRNYRGFAHTAREAADLAVFVGPLSHRALRARATPEDATIQAFPTVREAAAWLRDELGAGDLVLLKGSNRADHLLRIVLDRDDAVGCWQERCDRITFCNHCPELRATPALMSRTKPGAAQSG
jgi:UDP-N-acetylmuramyl pentapeptide synthase